MRHRCTTQLTNSLTIRQILLRTGCLTNISPSNFIGPIVIITIHYTVIWSIDRFKASHAILNTLRPSKIHPRGWCWTRCLAKIIITCYNIPTCTLSAMINSSAFHTSCNSANLAGILSRNIFNVLIWSAVCHTMRAIRRLLFGFRRTLQ